MLARLKDKKLLVFLDQGIVSLSNFILGILLARYLGVEGYGQFALFWLIVLFFSSLQQAFIISPMLTLGSKKNIGIIDNYLITMFNLQLFVIIIILIFLSVFFEIVVFFDSKWDVGELKKYIFITTVFFLLQEFLRRYLILKLKYYNLLFMDGIAYLGQIIFVIFFIYLDGLELKTVFLSVAMPFFLSVLIGYIQVKKVRIKKKYRKLVFLKNWKFSKWLIYTAILQWGSANFFILASGVILGDWAVGVIRIMQNTMGIFNVFFISLENILPTIFSQIYCKNGYKKMIIFLNNQIKYGVVLFGIISLIVSGISQTLIEFLYGKEYLQYAYLLVGFVVIYFFIYINILQRHMLRTLEITKVMFISYIITTSFSLLSSYPLIKYFKLDGVVMGILIIQLIISLIFYNYIKNQNI